MAFKLASGDQYDFFGAPKPAAPLVVPPATSSAPAAGPSNANGTSGDGWQTVERKRGGGPSGGGGRGRGPRGRGRGGGGGGRGGGTGGLDEDVGMSDAAAADGGPSRRDRRHRGDPYARKGGKGKQRQDGDLDIRAPVGTPIAIKGAASGNTSAAKAALREAARGASPRPTSASVSAIATLKKLLASRWNAETKVINLDKLRDDPILKDAGFDAPGVKGAPVNTAAAMWKLCKSLYPEVQSISLNDNKLRKLHHMSPGVLAIELPHITALSLADNSFADLSDLNSLSPTIGGTAPAGSTKPGMIALRELVLTGNPVRVEADIKGNEGMQEYIVEAVRRFPTLQLVDSIPVDPSLKNRLPPPKTAMNASASTKLSGGAVKSTRRAEVAASDQASLDKQPEPALPLGIKGGLFDSDVTASIVAEFCQKFFATYDNDRGALLDVYSAEATFSFAVAMKVPMRAKAMRLHRNTAEMPTQEALNWQPYLDTSKSRNMFAMKAELKRAAALLTGPASIVNFIKTLPGTRHPVGEPDSIRNFVVDAFQVSGVRQNSIAQDGGTVLFVTVHGQFKELPATGIRSFDRMLVLGAAGPATAAAMKGWPCTILTDKLTLRGYSSPNAWAPSDTQPTSALVATSTSDQLTPEREQLVQQLSQATKLTPAAALDCLRANNWDPANAMANFEALKAGGSLPASAFMS